MSWDDWNRPATVAIYDLATGHIKRVTSCEAFQIFGQMAEDEGFVELTSRIDTAAWLVIDGVLTPISA